MTPKQHEAEDDIAILRRIANRDREAFALFYDRHAPFIFPLLVRIIQETSEAEDALQEVFWQVWREADRYSAARGTPRAWLVQIARSRGIDLLRKIRLRSSRNAGPIEEMETTIEPIVQNTAERKIIAQETQNKVRTLMEKIPADQRQALILAFFDDLTHREIATQLGVAIGTIKTRIRLGMEHLYELFHENGVLP